MAAELQSEENRFRERARHGRVPLLGEIGTKGKDRIWGEWPYYVKIGDQTYSGAANRDFVDVTDQPVEGREGFVHGRVWVHPFGHTKDGGIRAVLPPDWTGDETAVTLDPQTYRDALRRKLDLEEEQSKQ